MPPKKSRAAASKGKKAAAVDETAAVSIEQSGVEHQPSTVEEDTKHIRDVEESDRAAKKPRLDMDMDGEEDVQAAETVTTVAESKIAPSPPETADSREPPPPEEATPLTSNDDHLAENPIIVASSLTVGKTSAVEEESEDEEEEVYVPDEDDQQTRTDLYLDTINRPNLDFDFEKLCSVSLSNINIYGCLVCGKYFQGRGKSSWAYKHSVGEGHHVFLKLDEEKFYVLPDGYPVSDPSLTDIIHVLSPRYDKAQISQLSKMPHTSYDLSGKAYLPGYIGLNNIKANDYLNVVIHALLHVPPLRDFLLSPETEALKPEKKPTELVKRFSELAKKLWNPKLFKAQVSPHEFLQAVTEASDGQFKITQQGDPIAFLGWLLNRLHKDLGGSRKKNSSVIYSTFQGELHIETQQFVINKADAGGNKKPQFDISRDIQKMTSPYLFLALDLPPMPLFQDSVEKNIIPQVPISSILAKYDGVTTQEAGQNIKRHHLTKLPPYLILHIKRFTKNNFVEDKNPTIVNFPLRGVDFKDYIEDADISTLYDLVVNLPFESSIASTTMKKAGPSKATNPLKKQKDNAGETQWKVHLRAGEGGGDQEKWFSINDLRVDEVQKEMVFLGETVMQIWERRA